MTSRAVDPISRRTRVRTLAPLLLILLLPVRAHAGEVSGWEVYPSFEGPGAVVRELTEDGDGNLLGLTARGIARFDGVTWDPEFLGLTSLGGAPSHMLLDSQERLWISTFYSGVSVMEHGNLRRVEIDSPATLGYSFVEDGSGRIWAWLAGDSRNIWCFDGELWSEVPTISVLTGTRVLGVVVDAAGEPWVATDKAMGKIEGLLIHPEPVAGRDFTHLRVDPRGLVYLLQVGYPSTQVSARDTLGNWWIFQVPANYDYPAGGSVTIDGAGTCWSLFGCTLASRDLTSGRRREFKIPGCSSYTNSGGVIFPGSNGELWCSWAANHLARFDGQEFHEVGLADGLFDVSRASHLVHSDRSIWVASQTGQVARYDGRDTRAYRQVGSRNIQQNGDASIVRTTGGELWGRIPLQSGAAVAAVLDTNGWRELDTTEDPLDEYVFSIVPDPWGGIWIVHPEGVTHRSSVGWRTLRYGEEIPNPNFSSVQLLASVDRIGSLWLSDPGGLGAVHVDATDYSVRVYEVGPGRIVPDSLAFPPLETVLGLSFDVLNRPCFWSRSGIARLESRWSLLPSPARLRTGPLIDREGTAWALTYGDTLVRWAGSSWEAISLGDLLGTNTLLTLSHQGTLCLASREAFLTLDDGVWTRTAYPAPLAQLAGLVADSTGGVFALGRGNSLNTVVFRYADRSWRTYLGGRDFPDGYPVGIERGHNGYPWLQLNGSAPLRFNGTGWSTLDPIEGLGSSFGTVDIDRRGEVFIMSDALIRLSPDIAEPQTSLIEGPAGAIATRDVDVAVQAGYQESRGIAFSYELDGSGAPSSFDARSRWHFTLSEGPHEIDIRARDAYGNIESKPLRLRFTIDSSPPAVLLAGPRPGAVQGEVSIVGTTTDDRYGETQVDVRTVGGSAWTRLARSETPVTNGLIAIWNTASVPDGDYELRVSVVDTLSLTGSSAVQVTVDNQDPPASLTSPIEIRADTGGRVYSANGRIVVEFTPGALAENATARIDTLGPAGPALPESLASGVRALGPAAILSWGSLPLHRPARQEWRLPADLATSLTAAPALHRRAASGTWEIFGGTWDPATATVTAALADSGAYALYTSPGVGSGGSALLRDARIVPRVLSFSRGPAGPIGISFSLGAASSVDVRLFNRAGRVVRTIARSRSLEAGMNWLSWDGTDDAGQNLVDGLYILAIESAAERLTTTLSVTR